MEIPEELMNESMQNTVKLLSSLREMFIEIRTRLDAIEKKL